MSYNMAAMNPLHIPHIVELVLSFLDARDLRNSRAVSRSWYTHATKELRKKHDHVFEDGNEIRYFLYAILPAVRSAEETNLVHVTRFKTSPRFFVSPDAGIIYHFLRAMRRELQSLELNVTVAIEGQWRNLDHYSNPTGDDDDNNNDPTIPRNFFPALTSLTLIFNDEAETIHNPLNNPISKLFGYVCNNARNVRDLDVELWQNQVNNNNLNNHRVVTELFRVIFSSPVIGLQLKSLELVMDAQEVLIRGLDNVIRRRRITLKRLSLRTIDWLYLPIEEEDEGLFLSLLDPHKIILEELNLETDFIDMIPAGMFPKLKKLSLPIDIQSEGFQFLEGFPNLELLSVLSTIEFWHPPNAIEVDEDGLGNLHSYPNVSKVTCPFVGDTNMTRMISLFPNITTLAFVASPNQAVVIRRIFMELETLEELMIHVSYWDENINPMAPTFTMDSLLTGLDEGTGREILASRNDFNQLEINRNNGYGPRNVGIANLPRLRKLYIKSTGLREEEDLEYGRRQESQALTDAGVKFAILNMPLKLKEFRLMGHCLSQQCVEVLKDIFDNNVVLPGICRHCFIEHCKSVICERIM